MAHKMICPWCLHVRRVSKSVVIFQKMKFVQKCIKTPTPIKFDFLSVN